LSKTTKLILLYSLLQEISANRRECPRRTPQSSRNSWTKRSASGSMAADRILTGFDPFMNLVMDNAVEITKQNVRNNVGMVVIRGNSVVMLEAKDRL
jgi:small nuclear ribonucleoprotein G